MSVDVQGTRAVRLTGTPIERDIAQVANQLGLDQPPAAEARGARADTIRPKLPAAVRAAAAEGIAAYRASPEYAALIADRGTLSLRQFRTRLGEALTGPHFAQMLEMLEMLREPVSFDIDLDDFMPKAVSIGFMAEIVLIVGAGFGTGTVMNLDVSDASPSVYVGGSVDVGVEAGIEGDLCVGFWREAVDDLNGVYVGEEIDVDDGVGLTEAAFLKDDELGLIFVGADLGIEDGFENSDYYFTHFGIGHEPIYQPGDATCLVQFNSMKCLDSKDNYDSIYLEYMQDSDTTLYRYPAWDSFQMAESDNDSTYDLWQVGLVAKFDSSITLRLHVGDYTFDDQKVTLSQLQSANPYWITWDTKIDGFNEIKYQLEAKLKKS